MARKFGPFDTSVFYEVENRRLQRAFNQQTGFVKTGQGAVTAGTGAQLVVAAYPDGALIDGLYVENPTSETVTLTTNTASTNPRIDRLVMRLDMTAKTIAPFQIVGTPASSPTAPAVTSTANVVDMPLCRYTFPGSGSAQNPGSIVDERVYLPTTNNAGVTGIIIGAAPPPGQPIQMMFWHGNAALNGSGEYTAILPNGGFPNGIVGISLTVTGNVPVEMKLNAPASTLSSLRLRGYNPGGEVAATLSISTSVVLYGW